MSIRMFKTLYPYTKITDLFKSVEKIILHANNNKCIPQMGVCKVNIINKGIEYQCSFFVVPGNIQALLVMLQCERLQLLSINCQTMKKVETGK